ncbi:MAG: hypothetical protein PHY59_09565, partial [Methanobacterium sp.]|nr:hypothetical protein [Methanobacterium sp.]
MKELKSILISEINKNKKVIQKEIVSFEKKKNNYRNIELSETLQLILRKGVDKKIMSVGFPFPLLSYSMNNFKCKQNTEILIFLRGEKLRKFQREKFLEKLKKIAKIEYRKINSIKEFRNIAKRLCMDYSSVDYYDPYSFLGDSFIGLHLVENFIKKFKLNLNFIYSENYKNLGAVYKTKGYIGPVQNKRKILNLFSNLMDNQSDRTDYLVKVLASQKLPSIILGRDMIVIPEHNILK